MIPGIEARDEVGVGVFTTVKGVLPEAAVELVPAGTAAEDVVAPATVEQIGAAQAVDDVISSSGKHLVVLTVADDGLARVSADRETAVG